MGRLLFIYFSLTEIMCLNFQNEESLREAAFTLSYGQQANALFNQEEIDSLEGNYCQEMR